MFTLTTAITGLRNRSLELGETKVTNETTEIESSAEVASPVDVLVMRYGCTGTHGGVNKVCDHCANNIKNYPETPEGEQVWRDSKKIDEMVCRLPVGPDRKYWTQYIALHQDA